MSSYRQQVKYAPVESLQSTGRCERSLHRLGYPTMHLVRSVHCCCTPIAVHSLKKKTGCVSPGVLESLEIPAWHHAVPSLTAESAIFSRSTYLTTITGTTRGEGGVYRGQHPTEAARRVLCRKNAARLSEVLTDDWL